MENIPIPERDPSVGTVSFSQAEIEEMRRKGMTDEDIARKKMEADQGIAEKKIGSELKESGIELEP